MSAISKASKFLAIILLLAALGSAASFVYTLVVFSVDVSVSFTVFSLGTAGTNTTVSIGYPGNVTESYYFNTTNSNGQLVAPCGTPLQTNCQAGAGLPAYRIRNTGNTNATYYLNISTTLNGTGIYFCANSTAPAGCGTNGLAVLCDMSNLGNLNASAWLKVANNTGTTTPCFDVNVTLYANFSNVAAGTTVTRTLTINSTAGV
ncbi:hypothetical protein HY989_02385 [Candidatus Micrarchaeota archaeon]|nr:hypothetical protein [Candidatus Micrarchaeota archaeon]